MVTNFQDEAGRPLMEPWDSTDLTEVVPQVGDQVILNSDEALTVTARTFSYIASTNERTQTVRLTLSKKLGNDHPELLNSK